MNKITSVSLLLLLVAVTTMSCTQKTNGKTRVIYKDPITGNPVDPSNPTNPTNPSNPNDPYGCDGIPRNGVTDCYYSNLPRMVFSGPGTYLTTLWSSQNVDSSISQNQFRTDATLSIRIKPSFAYANERSSQGRICSGHTTTAFTKIKAWIMVRKVGTSITYPKEIIANVNSYSKKVSFSVPRGTSEPFIIEVIGINTNHRCMGYGSLSANEKAACAAGTLFHDIPVNKSPYATECLAMNLEFATDDTYDLPN